MKINRLHLAVLTGLFIGNAGAAEIEEIVITGQSIEESIPQDLSRYGNRVEVITADEIALHGFTDVMQTLQMLVPGLHVRPKNGQFDYFDASLHGSRNAEILWLIDGVRITNRLYNGTSPLDTVPAHMVERIEVLKGGQGIFYGTQSVGGVVNIVTKSFQEGNGGSVGAGLNSNNGYRMNGNYHFGNQMHEFVAYASKDESDGYQPWRESDIQPSSSDRERGFDVNMLGIKYGWNINDSSRLSLQYQNTRADLDFLRPYLTNTELNERDEDIFTVKYDWLISDDVGLYIKAYQHYWDTDYTRIYNELDGSGNPTGGLDIRNNPSYWGYEDYGFNAMAKFNFGDSFEYVLGFDHQNFSGYDDVWRIGALEEEVNAVFGQIRTTPGLLENTVLALGIRNNSPSNSEDSTVWNFSGKHNFSEEIYLRANIGTSFRLPDAEALFLNEYYDDDMDGVPDGGWFAIGNPNLKPEQSRNINIAFGGATGRASWEIIAFHREITDYIDSYVPLEIAGVVGESFVNSNDEVNVLGFEFISGLSLTDSTYLDFSYDQTSSELNSDGTQLTGIPESELKLRLNYEAQARPFGLSLTLNKVGDINARRDAKRGNYTVADVSGYYDFGTDRQHRISLRIENLGDAVYATRVDRGTLDLSGDSYIYDNLGMERTLHASYSYRF